MVEWRGMVKKRKLKTEWDLSAMFTSGDDKRMEKESKQVEKQVMKFVDKWRDRDDYLKEPRALREALDDYELWAGKYGTSGGAGYYWSLRSSQNQEDPKIKAKVNQIVEKSTKLYNEIQFFELRLAKVGEKQQKMFLKYKDLERYKHYLERLFASAKYLLSEPEEKIMNLKSVTSYANWVKMTQEFITKEERDILDINNKKKRASFSEILNTLNDQSMPVRDSAAEAFNDILAKHADVAEAEINSVLQNKKVNDDLRGMERPDLGRHLGDDIDTEVVDVLVQTVGNNFDIAKRYYALKAKLFGVKKLEYHERNVPYGKLNKKYTYAKAVDLVSRVFGDLDKDFRQIFNKFVDDGRIDALPRRSKASGAFCTHNLKVYPTYILLNHTDQLQDVLTMAHEAGHGINNELMRTKQHALHFDTPISTAEVASTYMEDFVLKELLRDADDELRLAMTMMKLNDDVSTIFRQIAFYRFEQDMHERWRSKGYLSKVELGRLFQKHMRAYMGPAVEQSKGSENWWIYVGHFRRFFYVYSYASGLLISKFLQRKTLEEKVFVLKVKEFLAAGTSDSPKDLFTGLGIDITKQSFWEEGVREVRDLLREAEGLASKMGKF